MGRVARFREEECDVEGCAYVGKYVDGMQDGFRVVKVLLCEDHHRHGGGMQLIRSVRIDRDGKLSVVMAPGMHVDG